MIHRPQKNEPRRERRRGRKDSVDLEQRETPRNSYRAARRDAHSARQSTEQTSAAAQPATRVTGPKSDDLHPAVRRLLSELDQLLSELQRASSAVPASPKNERERYICILVALSKFVRKIGGTLEQVRHIVELAQLLDDLDRGIVGPVLERTRFGQGRTGDSSLVWEARGRVALGLEALTRLGKYRKHAARSALHDFPGIGRLMTAKSKDSVDVMLSWHDEFLRWKAGKGRSKNSSLANTFVIGTDLLKLCDETPVLLRRFAQIHFELASRI